MSMCGRALPLKITQIVVVHRQKQVKVFEIAGSHLSCTQPCQVIPTGSASRNCTGIWCCADVIVPCAGGIHLNLRLQTRTGNALQKNCMGSWRTTDVAQTHHENTHGFAHQYPLTGPWRAGMRALHQDQPGCPRREVSCLPPCPCECERRGSLRAVAQDARQSPTAPEAR